MFELAVIRNDGLVRLLIKELPTIFMENVACLAKNMRRREVAALMSLAREKALEHPPGLVSRDNQQVRVSARQ